MMLFFSFKIYIVKHHLIKKDALKSSLIKRAPRQPISKMPRSIYYQPFFNRDIATYNMKQAYTILQTFL